MQQPVGSGAAAGDLRGYDKGALGFISLETLLYSPTLDPQLQTIADYVGTKPGGGVRNASLTSPLQLADELLLDPEDDLGEWTLRFTDRTGALRPVSARVTIGELQKHATELRVSAGKPLRASPPRSTTPRL